MYAYIPMVHFFNDRVHLIRAFRRPDCCRSAGVTMPSVNNLLFKPLSYYVLFFIHIYTEILGCGEDRGRHYEDVVYSDCRVSN